MSWQEWLKRNGENLKYTREDWIDFYNESIQDRDRKHERVLFRYLFFEDTIQFFTLSEIGRMVGYSHATVYYGLKAVKEWRETNYKPLQQMERDYQSKKEKHEKKTGIQKAKKDAGSTGDESV